MQPLVSIIVPTKNRYKYLKHLIRLVESFKSTDIELIVQDNSEDNLEIIEFLKEFKFGITKYYYDGDKLSMSQNSNLALLHSSGEYICFIGDDDGVTQHIVECVKWMKENGIEAARFSKILYLWPDFCPTQKSQRPGTCTYKDFKSTVNIIDSKVALDRALKNGFTNAYDLPSVYHGVVKHSVLKKIYDIGGTFFPGPSPDMASGVAVACLTSRYAFLDIPVIIMGVGASGSGGAQAVKKQIHYPEDLPFLSVQERNNWEECIPRFAARITIWPESAIKALRYLGLEDQIININYEKIYSKILGLNFLKLSLVNRVISLSKHKAKLLLSAIMLFFYIKCRAFVSNIVSSEVYFKIKGESMLKDCEHIIIVCSFFSEHNLIKKIFNKNNFIKIW